jgi:hypothetical protein
VAEDADEGPGTGIEPVASSVSGKTGRIALDTLTWLKVACTCDFIPLSMATVL